MMSRPFSRGIGLAPSASLSSTGTSKTSPCRIGLRVSRFMSSSFLFAYDEA
jgi:hypothetical protein